ncbi:MULTISPECIES: trehalose synthase [unclassified Acidiplasma]|jgi:heme A synthase|uniref:trehalose synthase n=2 Tax=Acidiplasma TaxID=507753 RepID=UPI001E35CA77|nr:MULTISPECIES: trehalose synthase [unclassified Acidiplasma]WMT55576.1 MAG: trehalose synthase [Acidiplasma sp.]
MLKFDKMDGLEKLLWSVSGLTVLQMTLGFYLSQISNPLNSRMLYVHIITGTLLFILALILIKPSGINKRLRNLSVVNSGLIVLTGIIGSGFIIFKNSTFYSIYMPYLHFLLAIGIISNYAVMLGIKRTL